jgi:hypothetical protein
MEQQQVTHNTTKQQALCWRLVTTIAFCLMSAPVDERTDTEALDPNAKNKLIVSKQKAMF